MFSVRITKSKNIVEITKNLEEKGYSVKTEGNFLIVDAPTDELFWGWFDLNI